MELGDLQQQVGCDYGYGISLFYDRDFALALAQLQKLLNHKDVLSELYIPICHVEWLVGICEFNTGFKSVGEDRLEKISVENVWNDDPDGVLFTLAQDILMLDSHELRAKHLYRIFDYLNIIGIKEDLSDYFKQKFKLDKQAIKFLADVEIDQLDIQEVNRFFQSLDNFQSDLVAELTGRLYNNQSLPVVQEYRKQYITFRLEENDYQYTYDCRKTFPRNSGDCHSMLTEVNILTADKRLSQSLLDEEKLMFSQPWWLHEEIGSVLINWLGFVIDCETELKIPSQNTDEPCENYWVRFSQTRNNNKITYPTFESYSGRCNREFMFAGFDVVSWDGYSGIWDMGRISQKDVSIENCGYLTLNDLGLFSDLDEAEIFAEIMDEYAPEHKPFVVVRLEISKA